MTDTAVMHALYPLAEFPVLAALASGHTAATKLDGRACLHLYVSALGDIDWLALTSREREFMRMLGLFSICPCCGASALVRDTRGHVLSRSDGSPVTIKALTGDYCNACGEVLLDAAEVARISAFMEGTLR